MRRGPFSIYRLSTTRIVVLLLATLAVDLIAHTVAPTGHRVAQSSDSGVCLRSDGHPLNQEDESPCRIPGHLCGATHHAHFACTLTSFSLTSPATPLISAGLALVWRRSFLPSAAMQTRAPPSA